MTACSEVNGSKHYQKSCSRNFAISADWAVTPCGLTGKTFWKEHAAFILRIEESVVLIQSHKNRELIAMTSTGATIKHRYTQAIAC
jgi:hypothetical protein